MKQKVLFSVPHLGGGGAEMNLVRVANELDAFDFEVAIAVSRRGGSYERLLSADVQLFNLGLEKTRSSTLQLLRSISPLRNLIQEFRPDILCGIMATC